MTNATHTLGIKGHAGGRALVALLLTLAGPVVYMLLLDNARMRASGAPAFGLMSAGAVLGISGFLYDRRWWVGLLGALNVLFLAFFFYGFYWLMALPPSEPLALGATAPEFVLPDQNGRPVALAAYRDAGPVLLVFYRGHW